MPNAVPQILGMEAGSPIWGLPGPTPGSTQQKCHCRASWVTHICQTSPHDSLHGLHLPKIRKPLPLCGPPQHPTRSPPLTWHTFISISDAPLWGSVCWVLVMGSLNCSSVRICLTYGFHSWVQDISARIIKTWVFHTFSLKITVFAFTDVGP